MQRLPISVIIVAQNADPTLSKTLASVSWADEIIVADDHSTDETVSIAKDHNAIVFPLPPTRSFAKKRNTALARASHDWVLFVDADEVVSKELGVELQKIELESNHAGYRIRRIDTFLGKELAYGEAGNMWLTRFGDKTSGVWKRRVHETWDIQGRIGTMNGVLHHTPHKSIASFLEKLNMYSELEIEERMKGKSAQNISIMRLYVELLTFPIAKFFLNFILKLGFLDGIVGFFHAYCMSFHSLFVRIKAIEYVRRSQYDKPLSIHR